jgi:predicted nucleic acid-binding protein
VILVDSNIPMYLVGAAHPNKDAARRLLEVAIAAGERLVTDAEVLQEILHCYVAIARRDAIEPAMEAVAGIVDEVYAIEVGDVRRAQRLLEAEARLSARDAIHIAIMERHGIDTIMSFDRAFDGLPGVTRLGSA